MIVESQVIVCDQQCAWAGDEGGRAVAQRFIDESDRHTYEHPYINGEESNTRCQQTRQQQRPQ